MPCQKDRLCFLLDTCRGNGNFEFLGEGIGKICATLFTVWRELIPLPFHQELLFPTGNFIRFRAVFGIELYPQSHLLREADTPRDRSRPRPLSPARPMAGCPALCCLDRYLEPIFPSLHTTRQ